MHKNNGVLLKSVPRVFCLYNLLLNGLSCMCSNIVSQVYVHPNIPLNRTPFGKLPKYKAIPMQHILRSNFRKSSISALLPVFKQHQSTDLMWARNSEEKESMKLVQFRYTITGCVWLSLMLHSFNQFIEICIHKWNNYISFNCMHE